MEAVMKTYTILLVIFLGFSVRSFSNPITPEALITEVYFEGDEWYAVVDCFLMEMLGINTFQEVGIYCSEGHFNFKADFLPDFNSYTTVITKDALINPLELDPINDYIHVFWEGWFDIMWLEWGDSPSDDVSGPGEEQALTVAYVWGDENWNYTFWLVKATEPCSISWDCTYKGMFDGYIVDQNEQAIPNAEIRYVSPYLMQATYTFPALITNDTGYFCHDHLFARNYHIYEIVVDDVVYEYDQYISVEPGQTNTYTFNMDFTLLPENPDPSMAFIANYPNPFSNQTTFNISLPAGLNRGNMELKILDVLGRLVANLDIDSNSIGEGNNNLLWKNDLPLGRGNYIALLTSNGGVLATNKITIK
jgi:hypothetical protein